MNAEQLLQNFDHIAEYPGSIAHLRRFILDLAVRGKLVEQDPNDDPASELLKQIQVEKARLEKEGEIKKQKPLPPISVDNEPFSIPTNWCWARLDGFTSYIQRGKSPKMAINQVVPLAPLAEQHRIVAKVDELMGLCDRLEAQIGINETDSSRLLESLLHQLRPL